MTQRYLAALLAALSLGGCTGGNDASLAGSEWRPLELAGRPVSSPAEMFVTFGGNDELRGNGGCNGFFGTYESGGGTLAIGPLGSTRMACDVNVMADETAFLDVLAQATAYRRERNALVLIEADGQTIARLIQTDAD